MPTLTVQNAEIKTATVEIKTLTISGKQVTLAVFRQLPREPLIADDGTLRGVPWGRVNYHPEPKACSEQEHFHIVWQRGTDLLRAVVGLEVEYDHRWSTRSGAPYLAARVREALLAGTDPGVDTRYDGVIDSLHGLKTKTLISSAITHAISCSRSVEDARRRAATDPTQVNYRGVTAVDELPVLEQSLAAALRALGSQSLEEARAAFVAEVEMEAARRRRHADLRRTLADLPQLFIAV